MYSVIDYLFIQIHGNADSHSGGAATYIEGFLIFIENLLANGTGAIKISLFPGILQMPNIHPLIVHFPIALLSIFFLLDFLGSIFKLSSWRRAASWFLYIGTISAILTVIAGFQAAASIPHNDIVHEIMHQHQMYGITVASLSILLSVWRILAKPNISFANFFYQLLSLILIIAMVLGADLGGLMVYKYGVATATYDKTTTAPSHDHHKHRH